MCVLTCALCTSVLVHMRVDLSVCTCVHVWVCVPMCAHLYVSMNVCLCVCMPVHMCACVYAYVLHACVR